MLDMQEIKWSKSSKEVFPTCQGRDQDIINKKMAVELLKWHLKNNKVFFGENLVPFPQENYRARD